MLAFLTEEAEIAVQVSAILGAIALSGRLLLGFTPVRRLARWITDGYREDREHRVVEILKEHLPDLLDSTLSFNGTGSFRNDMRLLDKRVCRVEDMVSTQATVDEFARKGVIERRKDTT